MRLKLERKDERITVPAEILATSFGLDPAQVPVLMRSGEITSRSETGEGDHAGRFRVTFWYGKRQVQLTCSDDGRILTRVASVARR